MSSTLELDQELWTPEALQRPPASLMAAQHRAAGRSVLGPSGLLGVAAVACTGVGADARALLRTEFGLSRSRAEASVKVGAALGETSGVDNTALGYLAGVAMSARQQSRLVAMLGGTVQDTGLPGDILSQASVERAGRNQRIGRLARRVVKAMDRPSQAVLAALLAAGVESGQAGLSAPGLTVGLAHSLLDRRRPSSSWRAADRLLAAAYAMSALSGAGLDLGSLRWAGAPPDWRCRAAPWVLPLLDETTSPALVQLLDAVRARSLAFVAPGTSPFAHPDSSEVTDYLRDVAVGQASRLTKWTDWPVWFGGEPGTPQVLLTQDDGFAYAWVGSSGRGQLVAFDTTDFFGWGLDEPGTAQALAYAIGWYVDVSVSLRVDAAGSTAVARTAGGSRLQGVSYRPTPGYDQQRRSVALGHHSPPRPHMRAAHVRDLVDKNPSAAALSHAPARVRNTMGPHDTWIRSASVGGAGVQDAMRTHLGSHSALADALGLMERTADA